MARSDDKTEKATPRRREEARKEGTVAKSQEVAVAASLVGAVFTLRIFVPHTVEVFGMQTRSLLATPVTDELPTARLLDAASQMSVAALAPFLGVAVVSGLVAGFSQVGFKITPKAAKPKLKNLSLKRGLRKFKPATATWELGRTLAKLGLLTAILWGPVTDYADYLLGDPGLDAGLARVADQTWTLLWRAVLVAALVAAADYAWNRHRTGKELRMSKHDVKREHKDSEGDPLLRAQRRRRQSELSRNRMLSDVAAADVVVTNPTHLAVALRYADGDPAPRIVARGAGHLATKIRGIAHRHGVPVTEDKPLARAMYRQCRVGQYVPAALYEAVAVVLALAYRRRGRAPTAAGQAD